MSVLADVSIREQVALGRIGIEPFDPENVQPSSVDVRLHHEFGVMDTHDATVIDPRRGASVTKVVRKAPDDPFVLHPGEFALASTVERIRIPPDVVCRIEGKSSLGRLGLVIHSTAGFIDPGFEGQVTLELSNLARLAILLWPGMLIAQLSFMWLDRTCEVPYGDPQLGSKYQHQQGPTGTLYHLNNSRQAAS